MLVNLVTNVVIVIMFGFYTTIGALDSKSMWVADAQSFSIIIRMANKI